MWLAKYPYMNKDNFVSFNDWWDRLNTEISKRPAEDILRESLEIEAKLKIKGSVTTSKNQA